MIAVDLYISDLMPDFRNPRIGNATTKIDALERIVRLQGDKLGALAESICTYGLSPYENMGVMRTDEFPDKDVIMEGNRRTAALILLQNPAMIDNMNVFTESPKLTALGNRLKVIAGNFDPSSVEPISGVRADAREDHQYWMLLRHGTGLDGAGIERWTGVESRRFSADEDDRIIVSADFLKNHGNLSAVEIEALEDINWSTFERFIDSPDLRERLGFERSSRVLTATIEAEEIAKGLRAIAFRVVNGEYDSRKQNTVKQRLKAINDLPEDDQPDLTKTIEPVNLRLIKGTETTVVQKKKLKSRPKPDPKNRDRVFRKTDFDMPEGRILSTFYELCGLSNSRFPTACGVLFRILVEMLCVNYLTDRGIGTLGSKNRQLELYRLVELCALELRKVNPDADISAVEKIVKKGEVKGRMRVLHDYVHDRATFPAPRDLIAIADELRSFVAEICDQTDD